MNVEPVTSSSSSTSIVKQITVEAPIERAFRVFTAKMGSWWPREHHVGEGALKDCVVEPRAGGRWYEVTDAGATCEWGKVLAWEPPTRLVLAWQLNFEFKYDPALVTEVELRFTALGPGRTRVDFEHRNLDRFGPTAAKLGEMMAQGWAGILASYAGAASAG